MLGVFAASLVLLVPIVQAVVPTDPLAQIFASLQRIEHRIAGLGLPNLMLPNCAPPPQTNLSPLCYFDTTLDTTTIQAGSVRFIVHNNIPGTVSNATNGRIHYPPALNSPQDFTFNIPPLAGDGMISQASSASITLPVCQSLGAGCLSISGLAFDLIINPNGNVAEVTADDNTIHVIAFG